MKSLLNSETRRDLRIRLLAEFKTNRYDASFRRLVDIYIREALPIILKKLFYNVREKDLRKKVMNSSDWFQFWLVTLGEERLQLSFPILNNPFHHFDNAVLKQYPFHTIVRNIPVFMWKDLHTFSMSLIMHLATGQSIRKYREIIPMSKKMAHIFQNLQYGECNAEGYYLYCLVKLMGGSKAFFDMVFPFVSLSSNLDANKNTLRNYEPALKKLLEWDTVNVLDHIQQQRLLGFIDHKLYEMNNFSLKGRTLKSTLQLSQDYYAQQALRELRARQQMRENSLLKWSASKHQEWNYRHDEAWYAIFELRTSYDLEMESSQMSHCVRSYAEDCAKGSCHIWSLKKKTHDKNSWTSLVTMEMNSYSELVQIKARFNQRPKTEHMGMIKEWMDQERLEMSLYRY